MFSGGHLDRSEGFPEQDMWSLGVMVKGSGQKGELLGRRRRHLRCSCQYSYLVTK